MQRPTVFIPQLPMAKGPNGTWVNKPIDLNPAMDFGALEVVWPPGASVSSRDAIEREARRISELYDETQDYIIALGSPSLICILTWAIGRAGKKLRMLEWQNRDRRYAPTLLDSIFAE